MTDLQLIRITHIRCGEHSAVTYVAAPSEWEEDDIYTAINRAQNSYLESFKVAKEESKPPNDFRWGQPPYDKYPDRTVAEVKAEWETKRDEYNAWREERSKTNFGFGYYLRLEGFTDIYTMTEDQEFEVDWGHRHGVGIKYDDTQTDTLPTPAKLAGKKDYSDEDFG